MIFPKKSKAKDLPVFLANFPESLGDKVLHLSPEDAIKFMEEKGLIASWDWRKQLDINHSQTFTVAKAMKMNILQDIRSMIDKSLSEGMGFREFQKELKPMLQKKGWWGKKIVDGKKIQLGSPHRLKTIYQTNMQSSYMAGRYKAQYENIDNRPWGLYVNPSPEAPICKALAGQIRRLDSSFWDSRYPPNHYNCKSRVRALTDKQANRRGIPAPKYNNPDKSFRSNPGKDKWVPEKKDYDNDIWKVGQPVTTNKKA